MEEKEQKVKITAFILTMISLCFCIYTIKDTYAKYITNTSGNAELQIARWKILVNNQDVEQNNQLTSVITPVFEGNTNIAGNVIAPTAEGYFDLIIDATNTDVSFNYEITTSDCNNSAVTDLILSGYSLNGGARQSVVSNNGHLNLTGTIRYIDQTKTIRVRI